MTKGLAAVAATEIGSIAPPALIDDGDDRFLIVERLSPKGFERLEQQARIIDDLRLLVVPPTRCTSQETFAGLCEQAATTIQELLDQEHGDRQGALWSVTLSARNPWWREDPSWEPTPVIAKHLRGADTEAQVRHPVDVRIQVDSNLVHFSLNVRSRPLGKRPNEPTVTRTGALRPTVAAAMVRLALVRTSSGIASQGVYDPFCGSGTILAEALALDLPVFGSDIDSEAVGLTRQRLMRLRPTAATKSADDWTHRIFVHDVMKAGFPSRVTAKLVVANLPWGKQIKLERRTELFDATAALIASIVAQGGACALLTTQEAQLVARIRKGLKNPQCDVQKIGLLGQTPAIVLVSK
ncbi:MAG: TRM11 family SAM-dependent methyltransferase [Sciscionella sp.]